MYIACFACQLLATDGGIGFELVRNEMLITSTQITIEWERERSTKQIRLAKHSKTVAWETTTVRRDKTTLVVHSWADIVSWQKCTSQYSSNYNSPSTNVALARALNEDKLIHHTNKQTNNTIQIATNVQIIVLEFRIFFSSTCNRFVTIHYTPETPNIWIKDQIQKKTLF